MKPHFSLIKSMRTVADEVYPVGAPVSLADLFRRNGLRDSEPRSLTELLRRWSLKNRATVLSVLWQNTFLMRIVGEAKLTIPPPGIGFIEQEVTIEEKPDTFPRAVEFGVALSNSSFDAAFLCEVWTNDVKLMLLGPLTGKLQGTAQGPSGGTSVVVVGLGAAPTVQKIGSGLLALALSRQGIQESMFHTFSIQGDLSRDADALSKKSVLLTRVNVGPGVLDLYSTHLFYGGGFEGNGPSASERLDIQISQLNELAGFIKLTHRPENVALLMGDFNINARDATKHATGLTPYETLTGKLANLGLFDMWPFQFPQGTPVTPGPTDAGEDGAQFSGASWVCHPTDGGFCVADEGPSQPGSGRLDYLFCEKATDSHAFNVVVGRVQRMIFERPPGLNFPYLSDHLGLAFNLICSSR